MAVGVLNLFHPLRGAADKKLSLAYALSIAATELTLGNPAFPLYQWKFDSWVATLRWSVPIHVVGLLILFGANRWRLHQGKRGGPAVVWTDLHQHPALAGLAFFLCAEAANFLYLHSFSYHYGVYSLLLVLLLYTILCFAFSWLFGRQQQTDVYTAAPAATAKPTRDSKKVK